MAGYFFLGMLAAFGSFCILWVLLGWILPGGKGCAVVCCGVPDEGMICRYHWLRGLGLVAWPLLAVAEAKDIRHEYAEICSGEELLSRLEWERYGSNGAGNGDHTGCDQRRDISEL